MSTLNFSESNLKFKLEKMEAKSRVAFGVSCCERIFPRFKLYKNLINSNDSVLAYEAIGFLWESVESYHVDDEKINKYISLVDGITPNEDDEWLPERPAAEDAGAAIAYTLECLKKGTSQEVCWAARRVYEALDNYIISQMESGDVLSIDENEILLNDLIQAELIRQNRDLDDLLNKKFNFSDLRQRSQKEASLFIPELR